MAAAGPRTVAAILVAGGSGQRLGAAVAKAFVEIAGRSLLEHAVARFTGHDRVRDVVAVVPADLVETAVALVPGAVVVTGGRTRQLSVAAGLAVVAEDVDIVLVHDVARPFAPASLINRVLDGLALVVRPDASVPVLPVTDTIRRTDPESGLLVATVDRSTLVSVQTPQGFPRPVLVEAYARAAGVDATDDASLVEAIGGRLVAVRGSTRAFKITSPLDLSLAEVVAADEESR